MTHAITEPILAWQDDFALGHAPMDNTHREFVACVDALLRADDVSLHDALEAFGDHVRRHFAEEDEQMRQTAYGNAGCHIEEHEAVLRSLAEVQVALAEGRREVVRSFAHALADWFPEHARVMDQGLAGWLMQHRFGGSPVVIRRRETQRA
ncbi:MAG: hemerythrin domain-containing protein [Burkholderiales bacterium]|nr:hemerythrin domain-containing protein [Burkholderiales bacterium]